MRGYTQFAFGFIIGDHFAYSHNLGPAVQSPIKLILG